MIREPADATDGDRLDQQRFLRDLTSLLALPAFWSGNEPAFVLRTLFEALESLLPLEVCYGVALVRPGERLQLLRVGKQPASVMEAPWAPLVAFADAEPMTETTESFQIRDYQVQCVRMPIGYAGEAGRIVVGSRCADFPQLTQTTTLRTALSLAAAGLETARAIRERDDAQRAKDEFLAVLGHELRNPLAPIVTALELMTMKAGGHRSREQEIIERQVQHLKTLVDDLLDVSRITRGRIDLRTQRVDVADIVARAVEIVSPLMEQRQHDVRVQVSSGLMVEADPTRMTQVVCNLLVNAAKYTPPQGRVEVIAERRDGWIAIRVIDTGAGLPAELLPRVFDLFVQGRQSLARSEGGLGIGLALVQRLVQAHGGTASARSGGVGLGSEFSVQLPPAPGTVAEVRPDDRTSASEAPNRAQTAARVLVVDDNEDAAELAALVLAAAGHHVDVAHSGLEALQRAADATFDVVVLDIGLPDLDGYSVADELRTRFPSGQWRLIALTGYGQAHDHSRSAQAGFAVHLVKPVEPARLVEVVRRVVEGSNGDKRNAPLVANAKRPIPNTSR